MKLRIQNNSVRLRLTRTEVQQLSEAGEVSARAVFPNAEELRYTVLCAEGQSGGVQARFEARAIIVTIPEKAVREWADSEQVSIDGSERLTENERLDILIEKDFACLTPREGEDESDLYAHPLQGRDRC